MVGCHTLKKFKVRSLQHWPSIKKSDNTEMFVLAGSVDGCSVLSETQFAWTHLCMNTTQVISVGVPFLLWELPERGQSLTSNCLYGLHSCFSSSLCPGVFSTREYFRKTAGFEIRVFPRGYVLESFPQGDTPAIQHGLKSEFFLS